MENIKRKRKLKGFREATLVGFLKKYGSEIPYELDRNEKIKLCSSDDFNAVAKNIENKFLNEKAPTMVSHIGGFYVTASLTGISSLSCKKNSKPKVVFFDRKIGNVQNGLFNTILMQLCDTKEKYLTTLFGFTNADIIKALQPALYVSYIENILADDVEFNQYNKKERKKLLKSIYALRKDEIDRLIAAKFINSEIIDSLLTDNFDLNAIVRHAKKKEYNGNKHYDELLKLANQKLSGEMLTMFRKLASNITEYLSFGDHYDELLKYLPTDIKLNNNYHILANDNIYNAYRELTGEKGTGSIKFVSGIDIATPEGVEALEKILRSENIIPDEPSTEKFPIDLAFIPHIHLLKGSYPFIKQNIQEYIMLDKQPKKKNHFIINSTAVLSTKTYDSIGAQAIEQERKNRPPLPELTKIEKEKGFPLISFMAGANYGNIYHSEVDTQNMVDMAIADKVDTVYIQGLIYATYYHTQTARRMLNDPAYETLDSRLKAARKLVEKLNDAGIKVVYQMGDEEIHLYEDIFKIYTREQGVTGNNFLTREDLRTKFDWVRPIIIGQVIPYLLRAGEDVVNLYTDEEKETRVSQICHALKLYNEGLPMGNLAKYINPKYLEDTEMFKVVYQTIDTFDKQDDSLSVNLIANPQFSHITQYGRPNSGIIKNLKMHQNGSVSSPGLKNNPQLFVDSRQGFMSLAYQGDQATLNVPQMIDDSYYIGNPELLPGMKEKIVSDPTHKRVTQGQTRPNFPGGWTVSGDIREKMIVIPYYKRPREMMEYVQKTGNGMPLKVKGLINDWQTGSPTERPYYDVKFIDYLFHSCSPTGLTIIGDLQQGHNYSKFPNESRHLGSMSVTQQMISNTKLLRPYTRNAFGVIQNGFKIETEKYKVDETISEEIIKHLSGLGLIEHNTGFYKNVDRVKRDIDYKTADLKLTPKLRPYEKIIREKLSSIINLEYADLLEGNHEFNTDWDHKGYNEIELLRQELANLKEYSGSDIDITLPEFLINSRGDFVNAPYTFRTINGYNEIDGHYFKPAGKGGGATPTVGIAKWIEQMGGNLPRIDLVNSAHYHIFESSVIDATLINITGGGAGQSGYEQNLGYSSQPLYVIEIFLPDGRILIETIGTKFLDDYKIQDSYVKEKGIDTFIQECMTEEAVVFDRDEPKQLQRLYQRKLVSRGPNKIIGPKID